MNRRTKTTLIAVAAVFAAAWIAVLFVELGVYNIGADDHHNKVTLALIEQLRDRSIDARLASIKPQLSATPEMVRAGAQHYATLCAGCHLAPGVAKSEVRTGLYPHPPNLAQEEMQESRRAFWVIKHGIKMSAMPAWEKTLDDAAVWDVVAFVRKMPGMSPEDYQQLAAAGSIRAGS
ncbi:MAG TPA: cytochrome c [Steroidobacteraceae bacterium]|nr:cytochrome c [Steroidobacteraceae bacterium]